MWLEEDEDDDGDDGECEELRVEFRDILPELNSCMLAFSCG